MRVRQKDSKIQVKVERLESFHIYLRAASEISQPFVTFFFEPGSAIPFITVFC